MSAMISDAPCRLALRTEGGWWVAYLAPLNTMQGATELARIKMKLVQDNETKEAFMEAMKIAVTAAVREVLGQEASWPNPPEPAPESEKSGSS